MTFINAKYIYKCTIFVADKMHYVNVILYLWSKITHSSVDVYTELKHHVLFEGCF